MPQSMQYKLSLAQGGGYITVRHTRLLLSCLSYSHNGKVRKRERKRAEQRVKSVNEQKTDDEQMLKIEFGAKNLDEHKREIEQAQGRLE